jgi:hypothetical protein
MRNLFRAPDPIDKALSSGRKANFPTVIPRTSHQSVFRRKPVPELIRDGLPVRRPKSALADLDAVVCADLG